MTSYDVTHLVQRSPRHERYFSGWFSRLQAVWSPDEGVLVVGFEFGTDPGDLVEDVAVAVVVRDTDGRVIAQRVEWIGWESFDDRTRRVCRLACTGGPASVEVVPTRG